MQDNPVSKKHFLIVLLFALCVVIFSFLYYQTYPNTKIVFCDVGQGDGTYIRIKNKIDILIDTGPANGAILSCLGTHMPFYDRTIEYAIISHLQNDHAGNLSEILKRYTVKHLFISEIPNIHSSIEFIRHLASVIKKQNISITVPSLHTYIHLPDSKLMFIPSHLYSYRVNPNDNSLIAILETKSTRVIFTGDAGIKSLYSIYISPSSLFTILKIPHHGSKNSLSESFYRMIHPDVAVISVGKHNIHGHPSSEVLVALTKLSIPLRRTDLEGTIVYHVK